MNERQNNTAQDCCAEQQSIPDPNIGFLQAKLDQEVGRMYQAKSFGLGFGATIPPHRWLDVLIQKRDRLNAELRQISEAIAMANNDPNFGNFANISRLVSEP